MKLVLVSKSLRDRKQVVSILNHIPAGAAVFSIPLQPHSARPCYADTPDCQEVEFSP